MNEGTKCVTNGLRICKCGGGKWGEFVSCSPRTGYLSDSAPFSSHPPPARTSMKLLALLSLLALMLQEAGTASLPKTEREREGDQPRGEGDSYAVLHLGDYVLSLDNYDQVIDLSNYDELTDYRDQLPKVKGTSLASPTRTSFTQSTKAPRTPPSNPTMARPRTLGLLVSPTSHGLPTCLICVCLGSSVYCDNADLEDIPPLPQTTAYLYARFNRISHIRAGDFKGLTKLKRIDLSSNFISSIDDDALLLLPALQDLILPENKLAALPVLPTGIEVLDIRLNQLRSSGIQPEAFRALEKLQFLYLADNLLDSIPRSLPLSLRSLHLQCVLSRIT
ncbi:opticin isoform X4 [Eschrichtius robustus]|uniref:opticin isoform X4 n=1 Tax=Eschrichtius robustus TaxID=9764 RepID=UPI0035BF6F48